MLHASCFMFHVSRPVQPWPRNAAVEPQDGGDHEIPREAFPQGPRLDTEDAAGERGSGIRDSGHRLHDKRPDAVQEGRGGGRDEARGKRECGESDGECRGGDKDDIGGESGKREAPERARGYRRPRRPGDESDHPRIDESRHPPARRAPATP